MMSPTRRSPLRRWLAAASPHAAGERADLPTTTLTIGTHKLTAEIAATPEQRAQSGS